MNRNLVGFIASLTLAAGIFGLGYAADAPPAAPSLNDGIAEILVIAEPAPREKRDGSWLHQPFAVHYYVFIGKGGQYAVVSEETMGTNAAIRDVYNSQRLLGHVMVLPVVPDYPLDRTCT